MNAPAYLDVKHLRMIEAIARAGTVTGAGGKLGLTQSAVSHRLIELEERLGVSLFVRGPTRMTPTAAGARVLGSARKVLEELARIEENARTATAKPHAPIRVSTECHTSYHWLPRVLTRFQAAHPGVEVEIALESTGATLRALLTGRLDVALVFSEPEHAKVVREALFADEMVLALHPTHPLAARPYIRPSDLRSETILLPGLPPRLRPFLEAFARKGEIPLHNFKTLPLTEAIVEFTRAGLATALVARWSILPQLGSGALVARRITQRGVHRAWSAAIRRSAQDDSTLRAFVRHVRETGEPIARS